MKPIAEWTEEQKNHFWTLFIGECWHSFVPIPQDKYFYKCLSCGLKSYIILEQFNFYAGLSGFQRVKEYMEKEMPEVWNQYLYETHGNVWLSTKGWKRYDIILNEMLSLDNLLSFLMSNTEEWGWKECKYMKEWPRILPNGGSAFFCEKQCKDKPINCNGGKVKHPALLFTEGVK